MEFEEAFEFGMGEVGWGGGAEEAVDAASVGGWRGGGARGRRVLCLAWVGGGVGGNGGVAVVVVVVGGGTGRGSGLGDRWGRRREILGKPLAEEGDG